MTAAIAIPLKHVRRPEPPERRTLCEVRGGSLFPWDCIPGPRLSPREAKDRIRGLEAILHPRGRAERSPSEPVLSLVEEAVYRALVRKAEKFGAVYPTQQWLAQEVKRHKRTVQRALRSLKDRKLIEWDRRCKPDPAGGLNARGGVLVRQLSNLYRLLMPRPLADAIAALRSRRRDPPPPIDVMGEEIRARAAALRLDEGGLADGDRATAKALARADRVVIRAVSPSVNARLDAAGLSHERGGQSVQQSVVQESFFRGGAPDGA